MASYCAFYLCIILLRKRERERTGFFTLIVFLMLCGCSVLCQFQTVLLKNQDFNSSSYTFGVEKVMFHAYLSCA